MRSTPHRNAPPIQAVKPKHEANRNAIVNLRSETILDPVIVNVVTARQDGMDLDFALTKLFCTLEERLAKHCVKSKWLSPELLSSFFLRDSDPGSIERLLQDPLRVSDCELTTLFHLREDTQVPQDQSKTYTTRYYIRSFSMTAQQLRDIVAFMTSKGLGYPKLRVLSDMTATWEEEDILFLRYIGKTKRAPFRRHREDMLSGGPSNFLHRLMLTFDHLFPAILDSCTIFELQEIQQPSHMVRDTSAETRPPQSKSNESAHTSELEDLREQALIALFGQDSALNTTVNCAWSATGAAHDTVLSNDHYLKFQALKTEVFPFLSPGNFKKASIEVRERISAWAKDIQLYAATHKQSVSVYRNRTYGFTTRLREVIAEQAMPAIFEDDMNLLLIVGAGISPRSVS